MSLRFRPQLETLDQLVLLSTTGPVVLDPPPTEPVVVDFGSPTQDVSHIPPRQLPFPLPIPAPTPDDPATAETRAQIQASIVSAEREHVLLQGRLQEAIRTRDQIGFQLERAVDNLATWTGREQAAQNEIDRLNAAGVAQDHPDQVAARLALQFAREQRIAAQAVVDNVRAQYLAQLQRLNAIANEIRLNEFRIQFLNQMLDSLRPRQGEPV